MPRRIRLNHPNTWHHVMNRGADRQDVFAHDADYRKFEWLLGDACTRNSVEVHAYCLMTNHFHLLLSCPEAGLSEAMQSLQFRYAQWFNQRYDRDGPVFRGRFRSVLVETDRQLMTVGRYIHRNPLDAVTRDALASYRWSSLAAYVSTRRRPDWLRTDALQLPFGSDPARFRAFVETDLPSDSRPHLDGPQLGPTCDDVEAVVDSLLAASTRHPGSDAIKTARALAITLCVELRVAHGTELADRYGLASPATIRTIARRGRICVASDPYFADLRRQAIDRLRTGNRGDR